MSDELEKPEQAPEVTKPESSPSELSEDALKEVAGGTKGKGTAATGVRGGLATPGCINW